MVRSRRGDRLVDEYDLHGDLNDLPDLPPLYDEPMMSADEPHQRKQERTPTADQQLTPSPTSHFGSLANVGRILPKYSENARIMRGRASQPSLSQQPARTAPQSDLGVFDPLISAQDLERPYKPSPLAHGPQSQPQQERSSSKGKKHKKRHASKTRSNDKPDQHAQPSGRTIRKPANKKQQGSFVTRRLAPPTNRRHM
ncbi:hypothetical protein KEM55_001503 [Ascosphaera atra]|nr:hypothetical protein KEM55_001503 [Ascosphaera atra]